MDPCMFLRQLHPGQPAPRRANMPHGLLCSLVIFNEHSCSWQQDATVYISLDTSIIV